MHDKPVNIRLIRRLVVCNNADSLEQCLDAQLNAGENVCMSGTDSEEIVSLLAKAAFVRGVVDKEGVSVSDAVRELGARMRSYSRGAG